MTPTECVNNMQKCVSLNGRHSLRYLLVCMAHNMTSYTVPLTYIEMGGVN